MSNHTPGPWVAGRKDMASLIDGYYGKWIYSDSDYIAAAVMDKEKPWGEIMANAHLIAAAPEMLEALEKMVEAFRLLRENTDDPAVWFVPLQEAENNMKEALKQARGES